MSKADINITIHAEDRASSALLQSLWEMARLFGDDLEYGVAAAWILPLRWYVELTELEELIMAGAVGHFSVPVDAVRVAV